MLVFTQMARVLDVLEIFLNYHGHTYLRLDGSTPPLKRQVGREGGTERGREARRERGRRGREGGRERGRGRGGGRSREGESETRQFDVPG